MTRIVETAPALGITVLSLYAFSSDNWRRPAAEVGALMELFRRSLREQRTRCLDQGIALSVIGRRDRLPAALRMEIDAVEALTRHGTRLELRIAVDYSAREAIARAAVAFVAESRPESELQRFGDLVCRMSHGRPVPPVDLFIRTGGEQRLSDFLLWESAYAELFFRNEMWPDFTPVHLGQVVDAFHRRERRFGGVAPMRGRPRAVNA
jgi:undecaprenyl diphosphate synthase